MPNVSATALLDFLHLLEALKHLPRTGWRLRGIREGESVADHAFRMAVTAMLLADALNECGYALNVERVLRLALLHEIPEALLGDIPFPALEHLSEETKVRAESSATETLLSPLNGLGENYLALWREFRDGQSLESQVVRLADKLEMLLQAREYERTGARGLDAFWKNTESLSDFEFFPFVKELFETLRQRRSSPKE